MKRNRFKIPVLIVIILTLCIVGIVSLRFISSSFRYNFDVVFNCKDKHISYCSNGNGDFEEYSIPLPPSTAIAYRQSDTSVVYYTKQTYDSFLAYYQNKGFDVLDGNFLSKDNEVSFLITQIHSDDPMKYSFIQIEAIRSRADLVG